MAERVGGLSDQLSGQVRKSMIECEWVVEKRVVARVGD